MTDTTSDGAKLRRAPAPRAVSVPVAGGELAVTHWPPAGTGAPAGHGRSDHPGTDAPSVIALHGITANSHAFTRLARQLPGHHLYAPDLRGRSHSRALPGPYGLRAHLDDLVALTDQLARRAADDTSHRPVLVGHSMGGFLGALAAARHPERFARLVLVDGGLPIPAPPGDLDAQLDAVLGPALRRLTMTFPDRDTYHAFFRRHPAFAPHWGPDVAAYADRDLVGTAPQLGSSCVHAAVRVDGADVLGDREVVEAAHGLRLPAELLWAERGLQNEPGGLYTPDRLANAPLPTRRVPDTNHYSLLVTDHGTRAIAEAVTA